MNPEKLVPLLVTASQSFFFIVLGRVHRNRFIVKRNLHFTSYDFADPMAPCFGWGEKTWLEH